VSTELQSSSLPCLEVITSCHSAADLLDLTNGPELWEGRSALDGRLVLPYLSPDLVVSSIAGQVTLLNSVWVVGWDMSSI